MQPLVSVCMPAYNAGQFIAEAIRSVINQTYKNWELIIVNDGSTDETVSIIKTFPDERIKIFHQENKGQCAAANKAFKMSNGALIKFFDADDILSPSMLASQVARLNYTPLNVASAQWGRFYDNDLNTFKLSPESVWRDMPSTEWLVESWKNAQPMMQCALWLIPREIIVKAGLWDERLSLINDFDFFTRVLVNSQTVLFTSDACLYYRSGIKGSLSDTKTRKAFESAYLSIEQATQTLLNVRDDQNARLSCANIWQNFIYEAYPLYSDLVQKAESYKLHLPAPTLPYPSGGITKLMTLFFNWKTLKLIKNKLQR